MGQAQINVRTRACSGTFIARTKQAALTHNVRGKELINISTPLPHKYTYASRFTTRHILVYAATTHNTRLEMKRAKRDDVVY